MQRYRNLKSNKEKRPRHQKTGQLIFWQREKENLKTGLASIKRKSIKNN